MARTKEFDEHEVMEKAIRLFTDKGFYGISMQELVDGLGINRSSIYDSFGDKQQLFEATLKHYRQAYTQQMIEMIEQSSDIKKTISEIFDHIKTDSLTAKDNPGCMMVNTAVEVAPHEKKISNLVWDNMTSVVVALAKAIKSAQSQNAVSKKLSSEVLAHTILTAVNGLRVATRWGADPKIFDDVKKATLSLL